MKQDGTTGLGRKDQDDEEEEPYLLDKCGLLFRISPPPFL